MESQVFKIDDIDKSIIELIQKDPTLTHTEIAKRVDRSQPTIGMRIRKLEKAGVLKFQAGINVKTMDLILARVEIQTLEPNETIDEMVNFHFRKDPNVSSVYMDIITDVTNDFVLPFDFNFESCSLNSNSNGQCCGKCFK